MRQGRQLNRTLSACGAFRRWRTKSQTCRGDKAESTALNGRSSSTFEAQPAESELALPLPLRMRRISSTPIQALLELRHEALHRTHDDRVGQGQATLGRQHRTHRTMTLRSKCRPLTRSSMLCYYFASKRLTARKEGRRAPAVRGSIHLQEIFRFIPSPAAASDKASWRRSDTPSIAEHRRTTPNARCS